MPKKQPQIWSRENPEPPRAGQKSEFYWFFKDNENQPKISEVWAERCWWSPGWWGPRVVPPKEKIPR